MVETGKARPRRIREEFFDRYLQGQGVDVGCGDDPVTPDCERWEKDRGPLAGEYDWIYSSHCLEHIQDPEEAIKHWWTCLRPGGRLILVLPHRDLYERKLELPSRWNGDHRHFWVPLWDEAPCTRGLLATIMRAIPEAELLRLTKEDVGWYPRPVEEHAGGEYSLECVVRKRP